jgi:uncharacterized protein
MAGGWRSNTNLCNEPVMNHESKPFVAAVQASAGRLCLQTYAVTSSAAKPLLEIKAQLAAHLVYLAELERNGKLFMAGPLGNDDGETWSGDGQLIYLCESFAEAQRIAQADPMHSSEARTFSIRPWIINDGAMQLSLKFSTQTLQIASP